jgi:uncharacterized membrane protein
MEFIFFLAIIGLFVYIQNISGRLARLEKLTRVERETLPKSVPLSPAGQIPRPIVPQSVVPEPGVPLVAPEGLHRPVSDISPAQWVGGVGVVALLFGLAFFFKFAIDQGWITEGMRVAIGFVVGGLFLLLGDLWKKKYARYAQVLTGGGLALLYFTIFAAYQYYHMVEQPIAFLLTIGVTLLGVALSFRYASKVLGVLAIIGAYLSPLLISSGEDKQVGLFVYLTIVNVGVLVMLLKAYWTELLFIALLGTGVDFALWAMSFSSDANTGTSVAFLVFNYLLVGIITAILFRKAHEQKVVPAETDIHLGIFYSLFGVAVFGTVTGLLYEHFHDYLAPVMLLLAVITFLSYAVMDRLEYIKINYPLSFVGAKFLVATILWQFSGQTANTYLLVAAAIGMGVGIYVKRKDLRVWGLVLLLLATLRTVLQGVDMSSYVFLLNARFAVEAFATVLLFGFAYFYERAGFGGDETQVPAIVRAVGATVVWLAGSQEIVSQFSGIENENSRNLLLSLWWMAYAAVLAVLGGLRGMHILRKVAVVLFSCAVLKVFLYDVQALELGYRVVSFIVLGVLLLIVAFGYQKNKDKLERFWSGDEKRPVT